MLWPLVILYVFGMVIASPVDNILKETDIKTRDGARNSAMEAQILQLLEDLRQTMLTGSDDIPVMDPLAVDFFTLDENILPVPGLNLAVRDATVNKLSTFVVDDLSIQRTTLIPLRYLFTLDLMIPVLEVDSKYYELALPVEGINIFGSGDAKINIVEPRISGTALLRATAGFFTLYFQIQECDLKFSLKDFQPQIHGLLGGEGAVNDFINTFLQYLVVDAVKLYESDITAAINSVVLEVGNELLSDLNLFDLFG